MLSALAGHVVDHHIGGFGRREWGGGGVRAVLAFSARAPFAPLLDEFEAVLGDAEAVERDCRAWSRA